MTPETLSRVFKKFTKLGYIEKNASLYTIKERESLIYFFE